MSDRPFEPPPPGGPPPTERSPFEPTPPGGLPPTEHQPTTPPPTEQIPVQPSEPATGPYEPVGYEPAGGEYGPPPDDPYASTVFDEPEEPWYRKPGPLTAAIVGGILFVALLVFLLFQLFSNDGEQDITASRLLILTTDEAGAPIDRQFTADVTGPTDAPDDFVWLRPTDATAPDPATASTGTDGRLEFRWEPTDDVRNPSTWVSEISLRERIPRNWTPPGPIVECVRERQDEPNAVVEVEVEVQGADPTQRRTARYTFVDQQFQPGDTVNCTFSSVRPGGTTTTSSSTTSSSSSTSTTTSSTTTEVTTTTAPVTVPPTEPPTTPEPTTTSTTTTSTTTTTLAPTTTLPLQSAWQIIQDEPRLDDLESLLNECNSTALPIISTLSDPNETLTFFAPNNQAIRDAGIDVTSCPGGGEAVIARHLLEDQALDEVQLATMTELTMSSGETVDIVASGDTVDTIGGAQIVDPDLEASNGYVHVVDALLMPAP